MGTPKFDALAWTNACGCGEATTKSFCEIDQGAGSGLIIKVGADGAIRVTKYVAGNKINDAVVMTKLEVEALL